MTKLSDKPTDIIKYSFEEIQLVRFVKRSGYYTVSFNRLVKTDEPRHLRRLSVQALFKHKDCYISIHQALPDSTNRYRLIFAASYLAANINPLSSNSKIRKNILQL